MSQPRENTLIILWRFCGEIVTGYLGGIRSLMLGSKQNTEIKNKAYALLHILLSYGPKTFRQFPSGMKIGRSIFVPFFFIFRKK